ncbi:MAG: hypothetical protein WC787_01040 [Patescibacteria group bacterium]|jgi:GGDEF domain-containing protein
MANGIAEQQQDASADSRRAREGKNALLLQALIEKREASEQQLQTAHEGETDPVSLKESELQAGIASKRVEIFLREHDSTGAWKGERLGRDLALEMRDRPWERDAEGQLPIFHEDERAHLLMVHMGELDRLNASGDHALGDQGLRMTAERIESVVREVLGDDPSHKDERRLAESYDVYRHAGNDFVVNLRDVDATAAEEIRRRLMQEAVDLSAIRPGEEPIPIAASRITRADGLELLNRLDERPDAVGLTDQKVLIQAMIEKLQTLNDISKVEMRTDRILDKIREGQGSEAGETAARVLYDKFLRKSLGDVFKTNDATDLADYDAFRRLITDARALETPPPSEWTHLVTERAMGDAFQNLKSRRAVGRSIELRLAKNVAESVLKRNESFGTASEQDDLPPSTPDFMAPEDTRGKKRIKELEKQLEEIVQLAPRGSATEFVRVEVQLEKAKRDERTGLYGRGVYFETMEKGLAEGKSVSTVALDMAFLKYFDKEGGPETGNLAIKKAAEVLDNVVIAFAAKGVEIEAYRTGGDEFALTVIGGDERTLGDVIASLREGQRVAGRVPGTAGASPRYRSEGLQFNYGIRQALDADSFRGELTTLGIPLKDPSDPGATNELADYLVRLADKEIEIQKGVNRMMMLLNRMREGGEGSNVDVLKAYSQKALFGAAGEVKLREFVDRVTSASDPVVEMGRLRGEATAFVIEQIDLKNEKVANFETSLDRRLEDAVRIRFFEQRIAELEDEVSDLHAQLAAAGSNREMLHQAVSAAEEEKRAIVELRERMGPKREDSAEKTASQQAA